MRHISNTYQLLESKIEELMTFLKERNADLLKDISDVPFKDRDCRSEDEMINLPKDEVHFSFVYLEPNSGRNFPFMPQPGNFLNFIFALFFTALGFAELSSEN